VGEIISEWMGDIIPERRAASPGIGSRRLSGRLVTKSISPSGISPIKLRAAGEPIMAVVSLRNQQITVYDANGWILRAPVSSGQKGRETPAGIFSVIQKEAEHYSERRRLIGRIMKMPRRLAAKSCFEVGDHPPTQMKALSRSRGGSQQLPMRFEQGFDGCNSRD
jgi:L,D-transpeptidase catalytic domain